MLVKINVLSIRCGSQNTKHCIKESRKKRKNIKWRCASMKLFLFGVGTHNIGPHLVGTYKMCNSWEAEKNNLACLPPSLYLRDTHKPHFPPFKEISYLELENLLLCLQFYRFFLIIGFAPFTILSFKALNKRTQKWNECWCQNNN